MNMPNKKILNIFSAFFRQSWAASPPPPPGLKVKRATDPAAPSFFRAHADRFRKGQRDRYLPLGNHSTLPALLSLLAEGIP